MGRRVRCIWIFSLCVFLSASGCGRLPGIGRDADGGDSAAEASVETEAESGSGGDVGGSPSAPETAEDISRGTGPELTEDGSGEETVPEETAASSEQADREAASSEGAGRNARGEEKTEREMPTEDLEELEGLLLEDRFYYHYSLLTAPEDKRLYLEILCSLLRLDERTRLTTDDAAQVEEMFGRVMADHPEIFYVDGYTCVSYTLAGELVRLAFEGSYTMTPVQIENTRKMLESAAESWLAGAAAAGDDYGKVKYLYDRLITHTEYELGCPDSQNICSVLLNGKSVCQGYAKTLQYLCQKLGIPALLVTGRVKGQGHAWDLLMLDGEWYYADPTWGDASYRQTEGTGTGAVSFPAVNYDYFCVTTEQLERTHEPAGGQSLPVCSAAADQYYRREGLYLESADEAAVAALFVQAAAQGKQTVMFQCASSQIYEEVYRLLITEQKVFAFLPPQSRTASYVSFEEQRTFCFWLQEGTENG